MVTLQEFGDVEENVLSPDSRSVPESVKQEAEQLWCSGAPVRNRAERVQIENTLYPPPLLLVHPPGFCVVGLSKLTTIRINHIN